MGVLSNTSGRSGTELVEFPHNYIQPSQNDRRKIQAGYLDLIYYEYRRNKAGHFVGQGGAFIAIGVLVLVLQAYAVAVAIVLAVLGIMTIVGSGRKSKEFSGYRRALASELLRLGVGVEEDQLTDNMLFNSVWGELRHPGASGLGVVRPVTKMGFPEDMLYFFSVLEDKVYREERRDCS